MMHWAIRIVLAGISSTGVLLGAQRPNDVDAPLRPFLAHAITRLCPMVTLQSMKKYRIGPETNRLMLRALTVKDSEAFFAINGNPDVMRLTGEPLVQTLEEARDALASYPDYDTVGYGRWGCVLKQQQRVIGFCGLKYLHDLDAVDVGYRFLPEFWGRGFATEACLASVRFGFDVLKLDRIIGLVLADNAASIRVLEKVGMLPEGEIAYQGHQAMLYSVHPG